MRHPEQSLGDLPTNCVWPRVKGCCRFWNFRVLPVNVYPPPIICGGTRSHQARFLSNCPMPDPIRHTALSILNRLESSHYTLDGILDPTIEATPISARRDRNFIYALTHGTLRWQGRLDWILDQVSNTPIRKMNPKVRNILRLGLFQILFMDRVPASAAVNTAVDLSKTVAVPKITGFVNAVLRNAIRRREAVSFPDEAHNPVAALATRMSFPPWMIKRWIEQMGYEETVFARADSRSRTKPPSW